MKAFVFRTLLVCALAGVAAVASAQEIADPAETARFRWGPVRFTPSLEITNVGRDSNVFNEAQDPKTDFTAAFGPAVKLWVRPFGSRLSVRTGGQYLYFNEYEDQRAWNTNNEARWELPLARLTPFVGGAFVNSRERAGYEIDARSRRRDRSYIVGSRLRVSGKTEFVGSFEREILEYDDKETFVGAGLAEALNRQEDASRVQFRYALTPLTTFVTDVVVGRDRFEGNSLRDSDSLKVMPGFELKPLALISGTVFVGYKQFDPLDENVPAYTGVVAAVNAKYTYSATQLDLRVNRDVEYSFEASNPYYALLDYGLTVTERVTRHWDVLGQGSLQRLAYRSLESGSALTPDADRVDRGYIYGGGVGYRPNEAVRVGLNVMYSKRTSSQDLRNFTGTRIYGSITYGLQQ